MNSIKKFIFRLTIAASLFLLLIGIFNLYIFFFDSSFYRNLIEKKIGEAAHRKVSISHFRISFFKGLALSLENVIIKEKGEKENLLVADQLILTPYLFPLIEKQIAIKQVHIIHPVLQISRNRKGEINFLNWINEVIPEQRFSKIQTRKLFLPMIKNFAITKGFLNIQDFRVSDKPLTTKISDLNLKIERSLLKKSISFLVQGEINGSNKPAVFKIKSEIQIIPKNLTLENVALKGYINLNSFNLKHFQPYFTKLTGAKKWNRSIDADINYEGSIAKGFKSQGIIKSISPGSPQTPILSDPLKQLRLGLVYDLFWNKKKLDFQEIKITLNDLILTGKCLIKSPFSEDPFINFELKSDSLDTKVNINRVPFYLLPEPYQTFTDKVLKGNLNFQSIKFEGNYDQIINIKKQENFSHLSGKMSVDNVSFRIDPKEPVLKKITGTLELDRGKIKLSRMSGTYKDSSFSNLLCTISSPFEKQIIDLSVDLSLQLNQTLQVLITKTSILKNHLNQKKIKAVSGTAKAHIHLSGNLKKPLDLNYSGNIELQNVNFSHGNFERLLHDINGKARFYSQYSLAPENDKDIIRLLQNNMQRNNAKKGQYYYISSLSGKYGQSNFTNVTGGVLSIPAQSAFDLKINSDIDLKEIYPMLISRLDKNWMAEHFNKTNLKSGRSKVKIQITGNSTKISKLNILGAVQMEDVHIAHENVPLEISKLNGEVFLTKNEVKWKNINGVIGQSEFKISGKTSGYSSKNPKIDLQLNSNVSMKDIFKLISLPEKENYHMDGVAKIKLLIKGDYHAMKTIGEFDLTESSYHYKGWIKKKTGKKNNIILDSEINKLNKINFNKIKILFGENKIFGEGTITNLTYPYLNIRVNTFDFDLAKAAKFVDFLNNRLIAGKLSTNFSVRGDIKGKKRLKIRGKASLRNGSYKFDFSPNKIRNIASKFEFTNQKIAIDNLALTFGKSDATITGEITNFNKPRFNLTLKSKNFDLNQILPPKNRTIKEINSLFKSSPLFLASRGKIFLDADKGRFSFLKFPATKGEIEIKDGLITLNDMKMFFTKNYISTEILLNFLSDDGLDFSFTLHGKSFPAKDFEKIFEKYFKDSISGRLSLSTRLKGRGFNLDQITRSLSGDISLFLIKGNYNAQQLTTGIENIIAIGPKRKKKVFSKSGSKKYDFIKGSYVIKKSVAVTENFIVETPQQRISVIGDFDLGNKKLDLSVGIALFKELGKTVSKIPIVGTIITGGEDKSILMNYFTVKGKMGNPKITAAPLKSLENKVISLFKGVFQAPKEIFLPAK